MSKLPEEPEEDSDGPTLLEALVAEKTKPKSEPVGIDTNAVDRLSLTHREGDMAHKHKENCPCCNGGKSRVEKITLPDGRRAERHVFINDDDNEVVEVFAEESRPLKLEERILRERKKIVAKETREVIKDGEVSEVEVRSLEPEVPLQVRERIGVAEHAKIVDGDYVRKDEIAQIVADSVVAGVEALMENMEPVVEPRDDMIEEEVYEEPVVEKRREQSREPYFKAQAQEVVEKNVADKKQKDAMLNVVLGVILVAQMAFFGYMFFVM